MEWYSKAGVIARFVLVILASASAAAPSFARAEDAAFMGIAPTAHDLAAMRRTVRGLERVINEGGAAEQTRDLVSPNVTDANRDAIIELVRQIADALPPDSRYELRSDFTGAALVPTGPDRVQLQITATRIIRFAISDESVQLELEAVETEARRRWLLSDLNFPGQQTLLPKELAETPTALIVFVIGTALLGLIWLSWWIWRRRTRRR